MSILSPKTIPEEKWKKLIPHRDYAVRCRINEEILVRLGTGIGLYFTATQMKPGSLYMNSVDYETGDKSPQNPFPKDKPVCIGRTSDCEIIAKHAIVSRKHAEMKIKDDILVIRDLGSTNGTSIMKDHVSFDIKEYLDQHPVDQKTDGTLDWIHEEFGPKLDDFLKSYSKESKS